MLYIWELSYKFDLNQPTCVSHTWDKAHPHKYKLWVFQKLLCLFKLGYFTKNFINGTARFKNVNNCLNTNIYPYLETSGGEILIHI
jgi:hypothetical protein